MKEYYLWLLQLMGAANPKSLLLIQRYGSAELAYEAIARENDVRFLSPAEKKRLAALSLDNSERILEECGNKGIGIITLDDGDYPYRLKNIYNPPLLLFYKGSLKGLNSEVCISGVGARGATEYTAKVTKRTCTDLAKLGVILVSGMANGVDHIIHSSAVEAGGKTIGVLACGIDVDYPRGSSQLRKQICDLSGAYISELMPNTPASKAYFQARNRIISGLSLGTIVFQAGMGSGSLITADHAVQQGRDLFCFPPRDVFSADYCGVIKYLRDGAIPLFNYLDVVNYYFDSFTDKLDELNRKYDVSPEKHFAFGKSKTDAGDDTSVSGKNADKGIRKKTSSACVKRGGDAAEKFGFDKNEPEYKVIYDFLKQNGKQQLEAITDSCNISPDDISLYLLELEMADVIESFPGAYYGLKL